MKRFVKRRAGDLERIGAAFLSVSLARAEAENPAAPSERRLKAAKDAQAMIDTFFADTHWHPSTTGAVAGALMYSKYNFFIRYIMKRIARQAGGDTDTSRDYQYTDWKRLDEFVDELTSSVKHPEEKGKLAG